MAASAGARASTKVEIRRGKDEPVVRRDVYADRPLAEAEASQLLDGETRDAGALATEEQLRALLFREGEAPITVGRGPAQISPLVYQLWMQQILERLETHETPKFFAPYLPLLCHLVNQFCLKRG